MGNKINDQDILFQRDDWMFSYRTGVLLYRDNKILLQHIVGDDGYSIPGGHVSFGEFSRETLARELMEETGIDCPPEKLIFLGTLREPSAFMDCYLCRIDRAGEDVTVTLQEWETVDFKWVTFCEFETMIHKGLIPPPCAMRYGFVKAKLTEIIGDDAWLQAGAEEVSTLETASKETAVKEVTHE